MLKVKNILLLFFFSTLACSIARIFSFLYVNDTKTGFFMLRLRTGGIVIMFFTFFVLACAFIFPLFLKLKPTEFKGTDFLQGCVSIALGLTLAFDLINHLDKHAPHLWQFTLKQTFGFLSAIIFILLGICSFKQFKFPKVLLCLPTIFFIFQTIEVFSAYSTLSVISEHIYDLALLCFLLVFFLYFGKFFNGLQAKSDKLLFSVGICASILCISSFISRAVAVIIKGKTVVHSSLSLSVSILFFGIFIAVWVFKAYFNAENNR